ncbi:unknown [Tropheryma whipplei str. Twist]|uniref:Uncharacterized protein n=1 Tax=Tropheryma whipplei (strain Twist) TaxID=203267 RepID=Q83FR0_TROWT|nr:unknown [Tropheryma whipplei str. Twist]
MLPYKGYALPSTVNGRDPSINCQRLRGANRVQNNNHGGGQYPRAAYVLVLFITLYLFWVYLIGLGNYIC